MTSNAAALPRVLRAPHVSVRERLCRLVLGSPSIAYAFRDMRLQRVLKEKERAEARRRSSDVPVFEVDRRGWKGAERLPRLWLSEPRFDGRTGESTGRVFVEAYPHDPDPEGWHAYGLARKYFSEGLTYAPQGAEGGADRSDAAAHRAKRVRRDCFRAAEILYLHALRAGNAAARVGLATLYRFDMCEGSYWSGLLEKRARHRKTMDPQRRALMLFERAAALGDAESSLALGEMLLEGCGCEPDPAKALVRFREAYGDRTLGPDRFVRGKAAFRIAQCLESGMGAHYDFEAAKSWYGQAVEMLQQAFDDGEWHCKRQLVEARLGVARMAQELCGRY